MRTLRIPSGLLLPLLLWTAGCGPKRQATPPPPPPQSLVVLFPDPSGKPSRIEVTNQGGTQTLSESYQAVRILRIDTAPSAPFAMTPEEVRRIFGVALDALPLPEILFTLNFVEAKDELVPESAALLADVLRAVQERKSTSITIVGHTDTTGTPEGNYALGLKRAERVKEILLKEGVDASSVAVSSHGEGDPLIKQTGRYSEPRNRRVEIIVR